MVPFILLPCTPQTHIIRLSNWYYQPMHDNLAIYPHFPSSPIPIPHPISINSKRLYISNFFLPNISSCMAPGSKLLGLLIPFLNHLADRPRSGWPCTTPSHFPYTLSNLSSSFMDSCPLDFSPFFFFLFMALDITYMCNVIRAIPAGATPCCVCMRFPPLFHSSAPSLCVVFIPWIISKCVFVFVFLSSLTFAASSSSRHSFIISSLGQWT
jgi:hypothetical protein